MFLVFLQHAASKPYDENADDSDDTGNGVFDKLSQLSHVGILEVENRTPDDSNDLGKKAQGNSNHADSVLHFGLHSQFLQ